MKTTDGQSISRRCERSGEMQRINRQMNKYKGANETRGELLHNCSRGPTIVLMREVPRIERVHMIEV